MAINIIKQVPPTDHMKIDDEKLYIFLHPFIPDAYLVFQDETEVYLCLDNVHIALPNPFGKLAPNIKIHFAYNSSLMQDLQDSAPNLISNFMVVLQEKDGEHNRYVLQIPYDLMIDQRNKYTNWKPMDDMPRFIEYKQNANLGIEYKPNATGESRPMSSDTDDDRPKSLFNLTSPHEWETTGEMYKRRPR